MSMADNRKCSFYIYPERNAADRVADRFLEKLPQKERGRAMRAMMLCGAALMKQDERLPFLIAEFLTDSTSMQDIQRIISSTLPQQENGEVVRLLEAFLQSGADISCLRLILLRKKYLLQSIRISWKQETTLRTCFRMMNKN